MNILQIHNRYEKSNIKKVFKQYQLESILWGLWQLEDILNPIQKAYTTTVAIEFSEPGKYDDIIKPLERSILLYLIELATSFCLKIGEEGENFSNGTHDIFYYVFNLMANQFSVSYNSFGDYARALILYKIIPNEIGHEKLEYFLAHEFENDKGYSIEEYLQVCFIAFAAIKANGRFADDYFIKASIVMKTPDFKVMNAILSDISASAFHYRRERKRINSLDSFKYHPLLMYPLIKPWSHIPKNEKRKRYLSPLPNLIAHKAHFGIYHHFLTKHKTKFTTFFGKEIFERYIKKTLINCCNEDDLKDEDKIKKDLKIPNRVSIPDFLVISDEKGIIVECKAAVLPLSVYTTGNLDDFRTTVNKIYTGVNQAADFEEYALSNEIYGVIEWIRLVITYEHLWGVNSTVFSEILISDFKKEREAINFRERFKKTVLLSASQLDTIQPHISKIEPLYSIIKRILNSSFNEVINDLVNKTGRSFGDSYLAKYSDKLINSLVRR